MQIEGLSVVIPVYNEQGNVLPLANEIIAALDNALSYEIIFVDDASTDKTAEHIQQLAASCLQVHYVAHQKNRGQSAAVVTGVRQANYPWVATLDGDRQNDPKDLLVLIDALRQQTSTNILCMGQRATREDSWLKKISSRIANNVRQFFLRDDCPDSGCGIKVFPKQLFLHLPLFKNCHRFLPALFVRAGADVMHVKVSHRHRTEGESKYGVMNRLWVGIVDMIGVAWLMRRTIEGEQDV